MFFEPFMAVLLPSRLHHMDIYHPRAYWHYYIRFLHA
uniref:Uncharacterized protein n=1 Tax=Arundo donax TaxID=35708 RepID=A0A0A9ABN7_ARUDO